jgi:hypothetical protein
MFTDIKSSERNSLISGNKLVAAQHRGVHIVYD